MNVKLVFWDWMGTLFAQDLLDYSRFKNLTARGVLDSSLSLESLTFNESLCFKTQLKQFKSFKVPFTWFLVNSFVKNNVLQVIVSNGSKSSILEELDDYNPFDLILTSETFDPKPNLSMMLHAMDALSIHNKDEIIFIGDSVIDENSAHKLDVQFFKITKNFYQSAYNIAKTLNLI